MAFRRDCRGHIDAVHIFCSHGNGFFLPLKRSYGEFFNFINLHDSILRIFHSDDIPIRIKITRHPSGIGPLREIF